MLDLRFGDLEPAEDAGQNARDAFLRVGVPALQRVLDRLAPGDEVLRFEKVVFDLGAADLQSVEAAFCEHLERVAQEHLQQLAPVHRRGAGITGVSNRSSDRLDSGASVPTTDPEQEVARLTSEDRGNAGGAYLNNRQEVIEFAARFLEYGDAPWWSAARFQGDLEAAARIGSAILEAYEKSASLRESLFAILRRNPRGMLSRLAAEAWLVPVVEHLRLIGQSFEDDDSSHRGKTTTGASVIEPGDLSDCDQERIDTEVILGLAAGAGRRLGDLSALVSFPKPRQSADVVGRAETSGVINRSSQAPPAIEGAPIVEPAQPVSDPSAQVIFIDDAGIVLLQPFIALLFDELDLIDAGEFVSEQCRVKAIRLLEYLAWGTTTRAEFVLQFQKILCAQPANEPLLPVHLGKHEIAEADSVLDAVIRHWSVLKNTGRDGLRSTFLQRKGKIEIDDERGTLTVERQGVDVLLGKIPWSYSVMRLPWMAMPLTVDWP